MTRELRYGQPYAIPTLTEEILCLYEINHQTQAVSKDTSRGSTGDSFGLEEVAARMLFEAERPKFLMFERGNLGLPSEFEKF